MELEVPHVTVADIVALPDLHLSVCAGSTGLDRVITGAHVSEVLHAASLLDGGEFLMTTGSLLSEDDVDWAEYYREVVRRGAACLALGIGTGQRHKEVPQALLRAAEQHDLPVLSVPEGTPFIAVSKAIFAAHAERDRQVLEKSTDLQRELTRVAARERGLSGLVIAWRKATGEDAFVLDRRARVLASSLTFPGDVTATIAAAAETLRPLSSDVLRVDTSAGLASVMAIGATRHAGYLARLGHAGHYADLAAPTFLGLLALEFERRWLLDEPARRVRANHLARLLAQDDETKAVSQLKALSITTDQLRAVTIEARSEPEAEEILADLTISLGTPFVRRRARVVEAIVTDDPREVLSGFAAGVPIGLGTAVRPGLVARSMRQAQSALATSRRTGVIVEYVDGAAHSFLLSVADPDYLRSFSDAVLAPIDAAANGPALLSTLHAWFTEERSVVGCAERLGIHRHTVRHRIERITQLLGRSPEGVDTQTELWLALKARGIRDDANAATNG